MRNGIVVGRHVFAAAVLAATPLGLAQHADAAIVFSDTFSAGSTVNASAPLPAPTSTTTSYEVASTKNDTGTSSSTLGSGTFALKQVATGSGVTEAQALFSATPVSIATAGSTVDLRLTFVTNGVGIAPNADTLYFGLYSASGVAPLTTLQNAGLSAGTTFPTGGVSGWIGYVSQISPNSTTSTAKVVTRPAQTGGTNANQDLVGNGASTGTYTGGATISPNFINAAAAGLTNLQTYTEDLLITSNVDGSQTISSNLYQGADITGTNVVTQTVTTLTPVTSSFDGLAIGFRKSGVSSTGELDLSSLSVTTSAATPEPASLGILTMGGVALLARRRKA